MNDVLARFHDELDTLYAREEVDVFGTMLCEAFLGWSRTQMLLHRHETINQSDLLRFHWALEDLKRYRPIQHIIGHVDFCGCRIKVNPLVLVPRPETEEMVQWIVEHATPVQRRSVLDLCTGSGCIAIALKKAFGQVDVAAVDLSGDALSVAQENACVNGTEVAFQRADVLQMAPCAEHKYGLIVANPPYVRESERTMMSRNVLDYDPEMALFVPDSDALRFYRAIGKIAAAQLADGGMVCVEINEALADDSCGLFAKYGFAPEVHGDFRGKPRFVTAVREPQCAG